MLISKVWDNTNIKGKDKTPRKVGKIKESKNTVPQEHDIICCLVINIIHKRNITLGRSMLDVIT
jgi:hypothetical protein